MVQLFFIYGLTASLSVLVSFLKLNAPDVELALELFRLSNALYFISIGVLASLYGFKMEQPRGVGLTPMSSEFSDAYKNFTSRFLDAAPSDELGLKTANLLEHLDKTRLSELVTYDRLRIMMNETTHGRETKSAFESLFSAIVEIAGGTKLVKR